MQSDPSLPAGSDTPDAPWNEEDAVDFGSFQCVCGVWYYYTERDQSKYMTYHGTEERVGGWDRPLCAPCYRERLAGR